MSTNSSRSPIIPFYRTLIWVIVAMVGFVFPYFVPMMENGRFTTSGLVVLVGGVVLAILGYAVGLLEALVRKLYPKTPKHSKSVASDVTDLPQDYY